MRPKGYRFAVEWIAFNDDPAEMDLENIKGTISVGLVADIFSKSTMDVSLSVLKIRLDTQEREEKNKLCFALEELQLGWME